jgi:hypothetical protein
MKTFAYEKQQTAKSNTINSIGNGVSMPAVAIQKKGNPEEELPAQGKFTAQLAAEEEELPAQGKFIAQLAVGEDEEPLQMKAFQLAAAEEELPVQKKTNNTGLPDNLKSGVENLSGFDMSDVKVHYNSAKPAQLNAHAYAQGTDIHVASGQEKHLAHEAWHVVQQKQGRVQPTVQMKQGVPVNDDKGLETEADVMGAKAVQMKEEQRPVYIPVVQRETNLQIQQGPSCWLFVLEAIAKEKGLNTKYISIVMKSYPDSPGAVAKQKEEERGGRDISKRAAALELVSDNLMDDREAP